MRPIPPRRLAGVLSSLIQRHQVPGAQLAVWHGDELSVAEAGVEDGDRPMSADSTVPVGSITKAFTATLAMLLVADGDLELDTPIGEFLPELRGSELGGLLTLRQLLGHTSGLPSDPAEHCSSRRDLLGWLRPDMLVCAPATAFSYSSVGYALVGMLIEEATGMPWQEALETILIRPLGMDAAFIGCAGREPTAKGHAGRPGARPRVVEQMLAPVLAPVGGLALSARELIKFGQVHLGKPCLLDEATAREMYAPGDAEPFGLADGWGLGLARFHGKRTTWLGHDGTADGTSCRLRVDGEGQTVVALTTNAVGGAALWSSVLRELRALGLDIPDYRARGERARRVTVPAESRGGYRNGELEYVVETDTEGVVCLTVDGEVHRDLALYDCGTMSVPDPATGQRADCGRIVRDPRTGRVTALQVGGRLAERVRH
ncbi:hypothetical protein SD37_17095 [Amycolatopsis orientalis]|uniref:Beta-lactamase-related domain-containing protein n=1 Tax=Amycolatopsis orientalis TaxID=31958 RepID=A0A193CBK5_AMYOR|nr:hypothetical protein SD37_17095 [Amycolatopsis orientalis]